MPYIILKAYAKELALQGDHIFATILRK